jgi:Second Messenger Oligonucleotide or Dinucleotide Synthetase domain
MELGGNVYQKMSVSKAFDLFDEAISLERNEVLAARTRHQDVTKILEAVGLADSTFLQGSFARKTMRKPLKDVDMVIVLDVGVVDYLLALGSEGPRQALDLLKTPLSEHLPVQGFDLADEPAKALQVTFLDCSFKFDLVAAYEDPGGGDRVFIANREDGIWEPSNTRTLIRVVRDRNVLTRGRFVHHVRMGKEFKAHHRELDVPGLVIESIAYAAIKTATSYAKGLAALLREGASAVKGAVPDPTGVDDLASDWTEAQRATFAAVFASASHQADEAIKLEEDGETSAAIEIWHELLGDDFPQPVPQSEEEALTALAGGSITSTGRAVSSQHGTQPARPVRAWGFQ